MIFFLLYMNTIILIVVIQWKSTSFAEINTYLQMYDNWTQMRSNILSHYEYFT